MDDSIQLRLLGITYNQIESGVYALILEDVEKGRRLAIVIGYPEAQSIECKLQNVKTPRPLPHDLMASLLKSFGVKLVRVDIRKLPSGPYAGILTIENFFGERKEIDARSSDAIALAIRVGAPIFTNRELIEKEGFSPKETGISRVKIKSVRKETSNTNSFAGKSNEELQMLLMQCVEEENYETAAEIKKELKRRGLE